MTIASPKYGLRGFVCSCGGSAGVKKNYCVLGGYVAASTLPWSAR